VDAIVLEQMRKRLDICKIVNGYYFYVWVVDEAAETHTSDASETVDGYFLHCFLAN
jgi:hypothetical protein